MQVAALRKYFLRPLPRSPKGLDPGPKVPQNLPFRVQVLIIEDLLRLSCRIRVTIKTILRCARHREEAFYMRHSIGFWAFAFATLAIAVRAESFIVPVNGTLYMSAAGGSAGAVSTFGVGMSQSSYTPYFAGLPANPSPSGEVRVGTVATGQTVVFECPPYGTAKPIGLSQTASTDQASTVAFSDVNNTLGMGGKIIQQTGSNYMADASE